MSKLINNENAKLKLVEEIKEINQKNELEVYNKITTYIDNKFEHIQVEILRSVEDKLTKQDQRTIKKIDKLENKLNERIDPIEEKSTIAYDRTNTLGYTGKAKQVSEAVRDRAFYFTGDKTSPEYMLFYRKYISSIYKKLKAIYEVSSYTMINADELVNCLNAIKNWYPKENLKNETLQEYIKKQEKGLLPEHKSKALDLYLNKTQGGTKSYAV